jgi:hypothetical protein
LLFIAQASEGDEKLKGQNERLDVGSAKTQKSMHLEDSVFIEGNINEMAKFLSC